jgi:hypothetical protein
MSNKYILLSHPRGWKVAYLLLCALCMGFVGDPVATVSAQSVFVGAGDIAGTWNTDEATARLLDGIAGTVFTLGDNAYPNGTAANFTNYYNPTWGRHRAHTYPSPGNHDYNSPGATPYFNYFYSNNNPDLNTFDPQRRGYYSFDLGDWHIISLNSNIARGAGSAQEQWLRTDLDNNTKACTLAYWHHARFSSGANHGNNASMDALFRALYEYGADVVLTAHEHTYERFAPQDPDAQADPTGIRQFIVGTGGNSLYPLGSRQPNSEVFRNDTHGVLKLTLNATSYNWEFIPIAGQTFTDSGSAACFTSGPPSDGTQVTLNVTNGWDSKNQKTLVQDGKLSLVTASDNNRVEIESNHFLSLQFRGLRSNGSLQQATLYIEHHEETPFSPNALVLQAGGGALTDPFVALESTPAVLTEANEVTHAWDVTAWSRDATRANDFKLVVRNLDSGGKKIKIDRAYLVVTYGPTPVSQPTDIQVRLFATDGWDQKNQKTLGQDGKLYTVQGSDNQWGEVEAGYFTSYEFQGIRSDAIIQEVKLFVEHHEEEGISANPLVWQAATGPLDNPSPKVSNSPAVLSGPASEATVEWDVSTAINNVSLVNDLKLVVQNHATNGKKAKNDQVYVIVTYQDPS